MKKILLFVTMLVFVLAGCSSGDDKTIEELKVTFIPSRDPEEITTMTEPLEQMLIDELATQGYTVNDVTINVSSTYEAAGEALASGTTDVAFIPAGTYVLYEDSGAEVLLSATRGGLNKDSENPKDWNDGKATEMDSSNQVSYYRSLLVAGPSDEGKALADKVNAGESLTWEEIDGVNWCVRDPSSSAGNIYPSIWMNDNYQKTVADLSTSVQTTSYTDTISRLATEQCDVGSIYADARIDYADQWNEFGAEGSIWEGTNVIGVTDGIQNDTISVSANSSIMTDGLKEALSNAFISIGNSEEGKEVISVYSHEGYVPATPSDFDAERKAQEIVTGN